MSVVPFEKEIGVKWFIVDMTLEIIILSTHSS